MKIRRLLMLCGVASLLVVLGFAWYQQGLQRNQQVLFPSMKRTSAKAEPVDQRQADEQSNASAKQTKPEPSSKQASAAGKDLVKQAAPAVITEVPRNTGLNTANAGVTNKSWQMRKVNQASLSLAYLTERDRWLEFELPAGETMIKIATNGQLTQAARKQLPEKIPESTHWYYRLQAEMIDDAGTVISRRELTLRTRLTELLDEELGEVITGSFFLGNNLLPADSRSTFLNLASVEGKPNRLRVRLLDCSSPLSGVVVRIYARQPEPLHRLHRLWNRLPEDRRRELAAGNVFPHQFLTETEKLNVLRTRWAPIAPKGIVRQDYQVSNLYILHEQLDVIRDAPEPAGIMLTASRRGTVPIPPNAGRLRFDFHGDQLGQMLPGQIRLAWRGVRPSERSNIAIAWDGMSASSTHQFGPGLVEVEAPAVMWLRIFAESGSGEAPSESAKLATVDPSAGKSNSRDKVVSAPPSWIEITPPPLIVKGYQLSKVTRSQPLAFDILHVKNEVTPIRLEVRLVEHPSANQKADALLGAARADDFTHRSEQELESPNIAVRYQLINQAGEVVGKGTISDAAHWSRYDLVRHQSGLGKVSEPLQRFIELGPEVSRVLVEPTEQDCLITLSNRPGRLIRESLVPDDYLQANRTQVGQRAWFPLRPVEADELERKDQVSLVFTQIVPGDDDPQVLAGKFKWESLLPEHAYRGRYLVVREVDATVLAGNVQADSMPEQQQRQSRNEAIPGKYYPIAINRQVPIQLVRSGSFAGRIYRPITNDKLAAEPSLFSRIVHSNAPSKSLVVGSLNASISIAPMSSVPADSPNSALIASHVFEPSAFTLDTQRSDLLLPVIPAEISLEESLAAAPDQDDKGVLTRMNSEQPVDRDEGAVTAEPVLSRPNVHLIYHRGDDLPTSLTIYVDDKQILKTALTSRWGEVAIGDLFQKADAVNLRIETDANVSCHLNFIEPNHDSRQQALSKRFAVAFNDRPVELEYTKRSADAELLSLHLLGPAAHDLVLMTVKLAAVRQSGVQRDFTHLERNFKVRCKANAHGFALGSEQSVESMTTAFFPIGSDIPPGTYRLTLQAAKSVGRYVQVSRTTPGPYEKKIFFVEQAPSEE